MTVVLLTQALMFGDGGVTSLGLNALNMAIIAPLVGWGVYVMILPIVGTQSVGRKGIAVAIAAWASVFVAAAACAGELLVSYAVSSGEYGIAANISVPAMLGYHSVIGVGEAAISVGLVSYLSSVSPELFSSRENAVGSGRLSEWFASGIARASLAIILVFMLVIPLYIVYASEGLDGLERTMADSGADERSPALTAPFSYGESYLEILLAGILGPIGERAVINPFLIFDVEGGNMATYEVTTQKNNMSLRNDHNRGADRLGSIPNAQTVLAGDEIWTASSDLFNNSGVQINKASDKWAHLVNENAWIAILHLGVVYCTYKALTPPTPTPPPASKTVSVTIKVDGYRPQTVTVTLDPE